ncbi:hypothetical protein BCV71DRAFT_156625, partial [Rhizopus microsporus]
MNNEQESDKQEHEGMAKKRILEGIIPLPDSLYTTKRKGLSSFLSLTFVFGKTAAKLLCQSKMDCKDMELMKLCLSRNINFM